MTMRSPLSDTTERQARQCDTPPPDVAAFIRYCHARRRASWPELYDEMCAVAARREFNGWDHAELAARGLTFSLLEMPQLAAWSRRVLAGVAPEEDGSDGQHGSAAPTPRLRSQPVLA